MELIVKLAWRSIWRNRRRTIINLASICFGLAIAIFFISLDNGVYHQMVEDSARLQAGHITIENKGYLDAPNVDLYFTGANELKTEIGKLNGIERTKLLINGQGVAKSGSGSVGVGFIGIEPSLEVVTSPISEKIIKGKFLEDTDDNLVLIGSELAKKLNLDIGKKMVLSTNDSQGNLIEELCRIKGIFTLGSPEMDSYLVLAPINFTRKVTGLPDDSATQIGVILKVPEQLYSKQAEIRKIVTDPNLSVLTWKEVMPNLAAFIQLDYGMGIIFYSIIFVLVLFTIFNTILMSVIERKKEFAVLLAIGTFPQTLELQVVTEAAFLGLLGCLLGASLGIGFSLYYAAHGIDFTSMMGEQVSVSGSVVKAVIYNRLTPPIAGWSTLIVFVSTVVLSLIPMRRAANTPFSDVLR